jgi:hypothetical protein
LRFYHYTKVFESLRKISIVKWNSPSKRHWNKHQCICWWKMFLSIIQNIVSNAIKHSFIGGTIVVSAQLNLKGNYSDKRFWYGWWEVQDKLLHLKWVRCLKLERQ